MSDKTMILKGGARGRAAVPAWRQAELVREFERSGLSAPQFAASAGVRYATFAAPGGAGMSARNPRAVWTSQPWFGWRRWWMLAAAAA